MKFEIKNRDACGRIGKIETEHGSLITPTLLPVINPNKMVISPQTMKEKFGVQGIITNSYIIHQHQKLHNLALSDGVHNLVDFNGPIMTDSGTFQSYMYGDIEMDPLEIVRFQRDIGSDIGTILDIFSTPDQTEIEANESVNETIKRAKMSVFEKGNMNLACPVQGSIYPSLRTRCAKELGDIDADLHPIGGVVPLMENQSYDHLIEIILSSKKGLPVNRPVHLFGAGHPLVFPIAVALGCDLFDSSAYIKYAKQQRLIFPWGTEKLDDLYTLPCSCPICQSSSIEEMRSVSKRKQEQMIAEHNLYVSMTEMEKVRNAILQGRLWELVEQRASNNPFLKDAMDVLHLPNNIQWMEQFEPVRKTRGLFYTGMNTLHQPFFHRLHDRLIHWFDHSSKDLIVLSEKEKPFTKSYGNELLVIGTEFPESNIIIDSVIGPIPIELDEMYPFAQYVFPKHLDLDSDFIRQNRWNEFTENKNLIKWNKHTYESSELSDDKKNNWFSKFDEKRVKAVSHMQFGPDITNILFSGPISLVKSKKTKKIRNISVNKKHILSMRASDGLFILKLEAGKSIHKLSDSPRLRVIIDDDAVPFVKEGKSVFSKFVISADEGLRPYDECIVVSKKDEFLAVGQCLLSPYEMGVFQYGQAVKIREHVH